MFSPAPASVVSPSARAAFVWRPWASAWIAARVFAGGLVIESCFVNIVHGTWFGRYAREDSNFLPITMFLFFAWMVSRTRSVFSRIRRVIEPAFQQASKNIFSCQNVHARARENSKNSAG